MMAVFMLSMGPKSIRNRPGFWIVSYHVCADLSGNVVR